MKPTNKIFLVMLLICLFLPIFTINFNQNQISHNDNRYLTELDLSYDVSKMISNINSYINDRIGFRFEAIQIYQQTFAEVFGIMTNPLYEFGQDDHIYHSLKLEVKDNSYFESMGSFIERMSQFIEDRNVSFYMVTNPEKNYIYAENLPIGVNYQFLRKHTMENIFQSKDFTYYKTDEILMSSKADTFNLQYDPGHWNEWGAFVGTQYILKQIHIDYPYTYVINESDYDIKTINENYLPETNFEISDTVPFLTYKDSRIYQNKTLETELNIDSTFPFVYDIVNPKLPNAPRVLMFGGSYYITNDNVFKFMAEAFSELLFVHSYTNILDVDYYINVYQPDIVLFETVEYASGEYFYSQYAMDHTFFPPNITEFDDLTSESNKFIVSNDIDGKKPFKIIDYNPQSQILDIEFYIYQSKAKYVYITVDDFPYTVRIEDLGNYQIGRFSILKRNLAQGNIKITLIENDLKFKEELIFIDD